MFTIPLTMLVPVCSTAHKTCMIAQQEQKTGNPATVVFLKVLLHLPVFHLNLYKRDLGNLFFNIQQVIK